MNQIKIFLVFLFAGLFSINNKLISQNNRIQTSFSIKEKKADGSSLLTMGKVFYDKRKKQIVYQVSFPEKEIWVVTEKFLYLIVDGVVKKKEKNKVSIEKSLFNLYLTNALSDYGLKDSPYKLSGTTNEEDGSVISTWVPVKNKTDLFGTIMLSHTGTKISTIGLYNAKQKLIKKCFYKDYLSINNIDFPSNVIEITNSDEKGSENYQMTTYSAVVVDNVGEDEMYGYAIPSK